MVPPEYWSVSSSSARETLDRTWILWKVEFYSYLPHTPTRTNLVFQIFQLKRDNKTPKAYSFTNITAHEMAASHNAFGTQVFVKWLETLGVLTVVSDTWCTYSG